MNQQQAKKAACRLVSAEIHSLLDNGDLKWVYENPHTGEEYSPADQARLSKALNEIVVEMAQRGREKQ